VLRNSNLQLFESLEHQEDSAKAVGTPSSTSDQLIHGFAASISGINPSLARALQAQSKGETSETHRDRALDKQEERIKKTSAFEEITSGACTRAKNQPNQDAYFTNSEH